MNEVIQECADKIVDIMQQSATQIDTLYILAAQEVLTIYHPELKSFTAAMGTAFFQDQDDEILDEVDMATDYAEALEFLYDIDSMYFKHFGSIGLIIYKDHFEAA